MRGAGEERSGAGREKGERVERAVNYILMCEQNYKRRKGVEEELMWRESKLE